jgi:hypothetical protein
VKAAATILAFLLLAASATRGADSRWSVQVRTGWAGVSLEDVKNDRVSSAEVDDWMNIYGGHAVTETAETSGGLLVGWETSYRTGRMTGLGLRIDYLEPGDIKSSFRAEGDWGETARRTEVLSTGIVPVMVGWWVGDGKSMRGYLFAGPAFGSMVSRRNRSFSDPNTGEESDRETVTAARGTGVAFEAGGEAVFPLMRGLAVFVGSNWRRVVLDSIRNTGTVDIDGDGTDDIYRGSPVRRSDGRILRFDFSGWEFSAGLRVEL